MQKRVGVVFFFAQQKLVFRYPVENPFEVDLGCTIAGGSGGPHASVPQGGKSASGTAPGVTGTLSGSLAIGAAESGAASPSAPFARDGAKASGSPLVPPTLDEHRAVVEGSTTAAPDTALEGGARGAGLGQAPSVGGVCLRSVLQKKFKRRMLPGSSNDAQVAGEGGGGGGGGGSASTPVLLAGGSSGTTAAAQADAVLGARRERPPMANGSSSSHPPHPHILQPSMRKATCVGVPTTALTHLLRNAFPYCTTLQLGTVTFLFFRLFSPNSPSPAGDLPLAPGEVSSGPFSMRRMTAASATSSASADAPMLVIALNQQDDDDGCVARFTQCFVNVLVREELRIGYVSHQVELLMMAIEVMSNPAMAEVDGDAVERRGGWMTAKRGRRTSSAFSSGPVLAQGHGKLAAGEAVDGEGGVLSSPSGGRRALVGRRSHSSSGGPGRTALTEEDIFRNILQFALSAYDNGTAPVGNPSLPLLSSISASSLCVELYKLAESINGRYHHDIVINGLLRLPYSHLSGQVRQERTGYALGEPAEGHCFMSELSATIFMHEPTRIITLQDAEFPTSLERPYVEVVGKKVATLLPLAVIHARLVVMPHPWRLGSLFRQLELYLVEQHVQRRSTAQQQQQQPTSSAAPRANPPRVGTLISGGRRASESAVAPHADAARGTHPRHSAPGGSASDSVTGGHAEGRLAAVASTEYRQCAARGEAALAASDAYPSSSYNTVSRRSRSPTSSSHLGLSGSPRHPHTPPSTPNHGGSGGEASPHPPQETAMLSDTYEFLILEAIEFLRAFGAISLDQEGTIVFTHGDVCIRDLRSAAQSSASVMLEVLSPLWKVSTNGGDLIEDYDGLSSGFGSRWGSTSLHIRSGVKAGGDGDTENGSYGSIEEPQPTVMRHGLGVPLKDTSMGSAMVGVPPRSQGMESAATNPEQRILCAWGTLCSVCEEFSRRTATCIENGVRVATTGPSHQGQSTMPVGGSPSILLYPAMASRPSTSPSEQGFLPLPDVAPRLLGRALLGSCAVAPGTSRQPWFTRPEAYISGLSVHACSSLQTYRNMVEAHSSRIAPSVVSSARTSGSNVGSRASSGSAPSPVVIANDSGKALHARAASGSRRRLPQRLHADDGIVQLLSENVSDDAVAWLKVGLPAIRARIQQCYAARRAYIRLCIPGGGTAPAEGSLADGHPVLHGAAVEPGIAQGQRPQSPAAAVGSFVAPPDTSLLLSGAGSGSVRASASETQLGAGDGRVHGALAAPRHSTSPAAHVCMTQHVLHPPFCLSQSLSELNLPAAALGSGAPRRVKSSSDSVGVAAEPNENTLTACASRPQAVVAAVGSPKVSSPVGVEASGPQQRRLQFFPSSAHNRRNPLLLHRSKNQSAVGSALVEPVVERSDSLLQEKHPGGLYRSDSAVQEIGDCTTCASTESPASPGDRVSVGASTLRFDGTANAYSSQSSSCVSPRGGGYASGVNRFGSAAEPRCELRQEEAADAATRDSSAVAASTPILRGSCQHECRVGDVESGTTCAGPETAQYMPCEPHGETMVTGADVPHGGCSEAVLPSSDHRSQSQPSPCAPGSCASTIQPVPVLPAGNLSEFAIDAPDTLPYEVLIQFAFHHVVALLWGKAELNTDVLQRLLERNIRRLRPFLLHLPYILQLRAEQHARDCAGASGDSSCAYATAPSSKNTKYSKAESQLLQAMNLYDRLCLTETLKRHAGKQVDQVPIRILLHSVVNAFADVLIVGQSDNQSMSSAAL